jgi:glycosyltransferase involved in cell wall biosynthesis
VTQLSRLVSVLTPSFNQGRWLKDNLASVAMQTYAPIEHIVVDGGSNDDSVSHLEASESNVSWVSEPDGGQSDAINKAFRMSEGEILGWLNSDDAYFSRDAVEVAVRAFEQNPAASVVYGHGALVDAGGLVLHLVWVPKLNLSLLRLGNYIVQPSVFVRRAAIDDRLVDERLDFVMDRDLWLRLAAAGPFARVDRILAIDRHQMNRKVITMQEVGDREHAVLASRYDLPTGMRASLVRKARKLHYRVRGIGLIDGACHDLAFGGHIDSRARLLVRQLAVPRALMSTGEGAA